jgi:predicted nucleic acid-binding protein
MTTDRLCLDANYLVALLDARDMWHSEAARIDVALGDHVARSITPDCVVNEVLTVLARRCGERRRPWEFAPLANRVLETISEAAITWLYPHVPRWFGRCAALMRETSGALNFHDALLSVAAAEVGFKTIVSFDAIFDRLPGLERIGSAELARTWARKQVP